MYYKLLTYIYGPIKFIKKCHKGRKNKNERDLLAHLGWEIKKKKYINCAATKLSWWS